VVRLSLKDGASLSKALGRIASKVIREILGFDQPVLRQKAKRVGRVDDSTRRLLDDLAETMIAAPGAGLAAPQIGVLLRVVIFGVHANPRYPDVEEVPDTVLINPEITPLGEEMEDGWEGCLSVPGMRGVVPRLTRLRYAGFDENGQRFVREAGGFHARVVQHECDHLDGKIYLDRMRSMETLSFLPEFHRYWLRGDDD